MPNVKFDVTISGKWKPDGRKVRQALGGMVWLSLGAGGLWLSSQWGLLPSDLVSPVVAPGCRTAQPPAFTRCTEVRS